MTSSRILTYLSVFLLILGVRCSLYHMAVNKLHAHPDVIFTENLMFETSTTSLDDCALSCMNAPDCKLFTVTSFPMTCRGHSSMMTSEGVKIDSEGATTWFLAMFAWLERPCSSDAECDVPLSECFAGRCLCSPGYYYSHSTDSCVEECAEADLRAPFVVYPGYELDKNNLICLDGLTWQGCLSLCAQGTASRTCDFYDKGKCCLHQVTAADVPGSWLAIATATHLQKSCMSLKH